jgi:hypothetical protein
VANTAALDEIIKEVAAQHGVALGHDDPIIMLHTVNRRLLDDSTKAQQEILATFKKEIEEISNRWGRDAQNKAERTLTAALAASKEAMATVIAEATTQVVAGVRKEMSVALDSVSLSVSVQVNNAQTLSKINLLAAALTLLAASLTLWAMLSR